ncbi:MAG: M48 family metallopeptidase [Candidatus Staskawiczbacteria bacterium]|nr:M48 family metallopeptidase [Candidatus Staskawiczbacteria bacterium]MBI3337032.1 M48 family metallopeptidase [Candidatus Staskawiczbacteria bacterium]
MKYILKTNSRKYFLNNKEKAREIAESRIEYFNCFYKFYFNKIRIKKQKSRWGSCSEKGNLNFNYKIIFLPQKFSDYVFVHELCHIKEFNHSKKFWELVKKTIPDYKEIRNEFKKITVS